MSLWAVSQDFATDTAVPDCGPASVFPMAGVRVRGVPKRASHVARVPGLALMIAAAAAAWAWVGLTMAPARLSVVTASRRVGAVVTAAALDESERPAIGAAVATAST